MRTTRMAEELSAYEGSFILRLIPCGIIMALKFMAKIMRRASWQLDCVISIVLWSYLEEHLQLMRDIVSQHCLV